VAFLLLLLILLSYGRFSSNSGVLLATLVRLLSVQSEAEDVSLRWAGLGVRPGLAATMASVAKHPRASVPSDESFVANSIARRSVLVRMTDGAHQLLRGLVTSSTVPVEDFRLALP